ncbi:hypothetical protein J3F84DRAFT_405410 [Trichoderma pleuroticola]
MVTADKYFSFSISPPAGEPANSFFLGSGSDICNSGRLGLNRHFPRLSSQAILSREPAADDTVSAASVATVRHASHSSSWAATAADAPSAFAASRAKSLTNLPYKALEEEAQEKRHRDASFERELLAAKVKGIYAGLVMVETKCIEVDNTQSPPSEPEDTDSDDTLIPQNWLGYALNNSSSLPALIALHSTLLHEHHDFFLASQHPAASPALRRLASKYAMPARMWRHGIHSFLELLRHHLPDLMEYMLTFIYLAYTMMEHMLTFIYMTYTMMALLYETCLGDLGRYRMAIEDDDIRDREIRTGVSRCWYYMAPRISPTAGRLYHHLAILARPNAMQQLFYYLYYYQQLSPT